MFSVSNWDINILLWLGIQQWQPKFWEHLVLTIVKQSTPGKNTLFERLLVLKEAQEVAQNPSFENRRNGTGSEYVRAEAIAKQHSLGLSPGPNLK